MNETHKTGITEIVMLLDRSGSMFHLTDDTIGGFNAMLSKQRREPGTVNLSCVLFNDTSEVLYNRVPLEDVPDMTHRQYRPGGCTALYDAVGSAIDHMITVQRYLPKDRRADKVLFVITTDGYENASTRYTADRIRTMIGIERDCYNWEFLFLGADIDSITAAQSIGISKEYAADICADSSGMDAQYRSISCAIRMTRSRRPDERLNPLWKEAAEADRRNR